MFLSQILSFVAAAFLLAIMPGPDNIFVLTESLSKGAKNGAQISMGLSLGVLFHTTAIATGLTLLLTSSPWALKGVKFAGAIYLLYLAFLATKEKPIQVDSNHDVSDDSAWQRVRKGLLMNILNPKVSLFFISFLPQFVYPDGMKPMCQLFILGVIFMMVSFITFSAVSFLSGKVTHILERPKFWNITKWVKCTVFVLLALFLFFD
ncbi:LysE family translocator [Halosquirtibacter laminarini]|uniref:LysE family translocator n=1 Tax=Halosquirtibacter laminarini TaxID=3374600 RepID=A0AC61NHF1_9BACT|nr:LysE family translocator [Prolixibacteraceae bacterium]